MEQFCQIAILILVLCHTGHALVKIRSGCAYLDAQAMYSRIPYAYDDPDRDDIPEINTGYINITDEYITQSFKQLELVDGVQHCTLRLKALGKQLDLKFSINTSYHHVTKLSQLIFSFTENSYEFSLAPGYERPYACGKTIKHGLFQTALIRANDRKNAWEKLEFVIVASDHQDEAILTFTGLTLMVFSLGQESSHQLWWDSTNATIRPSQVIRGDTAESTVNIGELNEASNVVDASKANHVDNAATETPQSLRASETEAGWDSKAQIVTAMLVFAGIIIVIIVLLWRSIRRRSASTRRQQRMIANVEDYELRFLN